MSNMSQLVLTLTDGLTLKDLYFDIFDTNIAKKWAIEVGKNYTIYEDDRFINWINSTKDKNYYVDELNKQIKIVDEYAPNTIPFFLKLDQVNQNSFNILHKFFEDTRGPIEDPAEFYKNATDTVQTAINRFNIMIHEFESLMFNQTKNNVHPESRLIVTFKRRVRHELTDEDYDNFTINWTFGNVYINYCEVGKTIIDVLKDKDEIVGNNNIRPLRHYSADFQIKFSPSVGDDTVNRRMQVFKMKYNLRKEFFESLGFFYNKKLSLGLIPVAELNRKDSNFLNMSDFEIISSLDNFNKVSKTRIRD